MTKTQTSICPSCQKEFTYYPSAYRGKAKIFCSRECQKKDARIPAVCPQCSSEFWYHKSWPRKYCSRECSGKANLANLGKYADGEQPIHVTCDLCGESFQKAAKDIKNTKHNFCSQACFGKWLAETRKGIPRPEVRGKRPDLQDRITLHCPICTTSFDVKRSHASRRRFCSKECFAKWQSESESNRGENNFNYKGGYKNYYGPDWRPQRRKARERDNYTCQRCGITEEQLQRELDVHHIKPFRVFGLENHSEANHLDNLISLCCICHLITEPRT